MSEIVVAVFDTAEQAERAEHDLAAHNVPRNMMERYKPGDAGAPVIHGTQTTNTGDRIAGYDAEHSTAGYQGESGGGFWARLFGSDTHEDRTMYETHAKEGREILSVTCADEYQAAHIVDLLAAHTTTADIETHTTATSATEIAAPTTNSPSLTNTAKTEDVISLSEEQLAVGKRAVTGGTTRVRRYVVERPVEQQVTLQDETVTIERRHPTTQQSAGTTAFEDHTIEVSERREEPVIQKTAQVVEEVVIQKDKTERVETVHDTVRREEVEVDKSTIPQQR